MALISLTTTNSFGIIWSIGNVKEGEGYANSYRRKTQRVDKGIIIKRLYRFIIGRYQKESPGRSYVRKSMKPQAKRQLSK
jgi:hypothetical protein